jgi:dihydrofolate reductase
LYIRIRAMRRLIYLMNVSLDGFVEGPDGKFGWTMPDEEVHRFHNEAARQMGAVLYGRRLYETMAVWQTYGTDSSMPDYVAEYGRIWRATPKIVFSGTLKTVGENCRLVTGDAVAEVSSLKQQPGGVLGVGGPGLASSLAKAGLVDEYRLVIFPVIVGGGKSYFPVLDHELGLRLEETRTFQCGAVYLRYVRR